MKISFELKNIDDLNIVVPKLLQALDGVKLVCLHGEMGAGKTTTIKAILLHLGIQDASNSPTFSLINTYKSTSNEVVYHIDLYRLKTLDEAYDIGIEDVLYENNWCFIEWPDLIERLLPEKRAEVCISVTPDEKRIIELEIMND